MAFLKTADATLVKPAISRAAWDEVLHAATVAGGHFNERNASGALRRFHPDQYLLSHCTIVASVDTENGPGQLGRQMDNGFQVNRRFADYYVTPETSKYINNNNDCWERRLLLACFRTFVGGENYVEHLQVPEMSKGKIIDAAARDIGDSIYVDILVATDLRHRPLIAAIQKEQLKTLSMGCQVTHTTCTKCGNVAEDETQLCGHIKYQKGNLFLDGLGKQRKIAELCGHLIDEPGSVRFIEASWVANPAFTGAVLRNILTPQEAAMMGSRIQVAFSQIPRVTNPDLMSRAANRARSLAFDFGGPDGDEGGGEAKKPAEDAPFDKAVNEIAEALRDRAVRKLRDEIKGPESTILDSNLNETLTKEAALRTATVDPRWQKVALRLGRKVSDRKVLSHLLWGLFLYHHGGWNRVRMARAFTPRSMLALSRYVDEFTGQPRLPTEQDVYRTVLAVGGVAAYADENGYMAACRRAMGRTPTVSEADALIAKGRLYDLGSS